MAEAKQPRHKILGVFVGLRLLQRTHVDLCVCADASEVVAQHSFLLPNRGAPHFLGEQSLLFSRLSPLMCRERAVRGSDGATIYITGEDGPRTVVPSILQKCGVL